MSSFIRDSKFRHSAITVTKKEFHYENLRTYQSQNDINGVECNSNFLAYIDNMGSGSCLGVISLNNVGKNHVPVSSPAYQQPIIRAHPQTVQGFAFNPFKNTQVFTCSTDKTVRLWDIPEEGLVVDLLEPTASLEPNGKFPIRGILPHHSVDGLLCARGTKELSLFDLGTSSEVASLPASTFDGDIQSLSWSNLGDLLITTSKDRKLRMIDFRLHNSGSGGAVVCSVDSHTGLRFSRSLWLGDSPYLLSFGHNTAQEREILFWDSRNMSAGSVKRERLDSNNGPLMPMYDPDNNLLVLMGKGETSVRFYEVDTSTTAEGEAESAVLHPILNKTLGAANSDVIRGANILPKQANDLMGNEILRVLKLCESAIQPVSITVPRSERYKFHEDLFPDSMFEAPPASTAADWLSGINKLPNKVPIKPKGTMKMDLNNSQDEEDTGDKATDLSQKSSSPLRPKSNRFGSAAATNAKYRHMYGTENIKENTYFDLFPDLTANDSPIIASNSSYWAIPYRGGGGPVYVSRLEDFGKVSPDCAVINGQKASVQDISFSPFHPGLMATGSADCTVKIWDVGRVFEESTEPTRVTVGKGELIKPPEQLKETTPLMSLTSHTNSIRTCSFHPTVESLLCSSAQDATLRLFDVEQGKELSRFDVFAESISHSVSFSSASLPPIVNTSFNFDGTLIAIASKDRMVRILDPRTNSGVQMLEPSAEGSKKALGRNLRVLWCCTPETGPQGPLVTVCSNHTGMREIHLWDFRNMEKPLVTRAMDAASGQLFPLFDEGLNTVFLAGKGDTIIRSFELVSLEETASTPETFDCKNLTLEKSADFQSSIEPIAGVCLLPKQTCDIRNVEVAKLMKLTKSSCVPISYKVPRAQHLKEYFHDDIFPKARSRRRSSTVSNWVNPDTPKESFAPILESLKPEDMVSISEKPPEAPPSDRNSKVLSFRMEREKQEEENKIRERRYSKLQELAVQNAQYNKNLSGSMRINGVVVNHKAEEEEVDSDDNWDDDDD